MTTETKPHASTHTCTVIKPLMMGHQGCKVGDTLTLTLAQARPLQHAGFITLDQAAAACIQQLLEREQALLAPTPLLTDVMVEEAPPTTATAHTNTSENINTNTDSHTPYERGD